MSKDAKQSLAVPDAKDDKKEQTRKMTQAILEDQENEKEAYMFLEDDDDFEEFENEDYDYDAIINKGGDVDMNTGAKDGQDKSADEFNLKMWHNDWDDVDQEGDFINQLRAEIKH